MKRQALVFVGIKGCVVALDRDSGNEVWRTQAGSDYVTVLWDGEALLAATSGEVSRLDPNSGATLWHNKLKGLGRGLVNLASTNAPTQTGTETSAEYLHRAATAAAAAAAT
jgi:outer membrane protein assembly factor BamB